MKPVRVGTLALDPGARRATVQGQEFVLTGYEFSLLYALASRAGRVLSRDQLIELAGGSVGDPNKAYKESHPNIEEYQNTYEPPYYDYSFMTEFTQPLYKQLLQHYLNGAPISAGALAELNRIWKDSGQGETFNEFIYDVVKPLLSP